MPYVVVGQYHDLLTPRDASVQSCDTHVTQSRHEHVQSWEKIRDPVRATYKDMHNYEHFLRDKAPVSPGRTPLKVSVGVQTDREMFECSVCFKLYTKKYSMVRHMNIEHRKEERFACPKCDIVIKRKDTFKEHTRFCSGEAKKIECSTCGTKFRHKSELKRHEDSIHKKLHIFKCDKCDFSTRLYRQLAIHKAYEHSLRKSVSICKECNVDFRNNRRLRQHKKRPCSDENSSLICNFCLVSFRTIKIKEAHMRSVHENVNLEINDIIARELT